MALTGQLQVWHRDKVVLVASLAIGLNDTVAAMHTGWGAAGTALPWLPTQRSVDSCWGVLLGGGVGVGGGGGVIEGWAGEGRFLAMHT